MTKAAQNLLLITLGLAVLWITLGTGEYVNYVKPGLGYVLVAAAAVMIVLGGAGLRREWHDTGHGDPGCEAHDGEHGEEHDGEHGDEHGHAGHARGPRVAWLLCVPALVVFVVAPPALGSFTAQRNAGRSASPPAPPDEGYGRLAASATPIDMTMGEFVGRSFETQTGYDNGLREARVRLTGFVTPRKSGGWRLTRLKMACCAGDAIPYQVIVHGLAAPKADTWVRVVGVWAPPAGGKVVTGVHELRGQTVEKVKKPKNPYE